MKKLFIVVLYKTQVLATPIIQSFLRCGLFSNDENIFYLWDNSPDTQKREDIIELQKKGNNIVYDFHPENTPLGIVYNSIIEKYNNVDYIAIFDQDTEILDSNYEEILDKAIIENKNVNLFMPVIYTLKDEIYSPGKNILPGKNRKLKTVLYGLNNCKNLTGITSGIVISADYIQKKYKFNETLKLYGVDTDFFYHYSKNNKFLYLLKMNIKHDLSFENTEISAEENWQRFLERITVYFNIYKTRRERLFVYIWIVYYKLLHKLNLLRYK